MKKFLAIIGGISLVLLLAAAIFFGYGAYRGSKLDASSKIFIEEHIPRILSTWSKDDLLKLSSPTLLEIINKDPHSLDLLFKKTAALGKLQQLYDIKGGSNFSFTTKHGAVTTARYTAKAKFDNGDATIDIQMIQSSGQWQLLGFFINSPFLLQ